MIRQDHTNFVLADTRSEEQEIRYLDPKNMEEEVKEKQRKNGSQMRRANIRAA